ncbi:MAG: hypothetical protein P4L73_01385 [Caulobacteraceae bacterium]|nr:hypothetical protein [Caulobacteraceae bacterium]
MSDPTGNRSQLCSCDVGTDQSVTSPGGYNLTVEGDGTIVFTSPPPLNIPSEGLLDSSNGYDFTSSDFSGTCAAFGGGASCGQLGLNTVANQAMVGMVGIPAVGVAGGGAVVAGGLLAEGSVAAESGPLSGASFAQKTFSQAFSADGAFAGRTVSDVAGSLQAGELSAADVPVQFIVRAGTPSF